MNVTILLSTVLVELLLAVLGFISMHLRAEAHRRRLHSLPRWELSPWLWERMSDVRDSDTEKGNTSKVKKPRPRQL